MTPISPKGKKRIETGEKSYGNKVDKFDLRDPRTVEEIRRQLLQGKLPKAERKKLEQIIALKLRTTLFREIAVHYILPEILFILRIPKDKIGKAKQALRIMLNGIADAYQGYKEMTLKTKDEKKLMEELEFKERLITTSINETKEELEKLGLKVNLGFVKKLCEKRLKEADEYINRQL